MWTTRIETAGWQRYSNLSLAKSQFSSFVSSEFVTFSGQSYGILTPPPPHNRISSLCTKVDSLHVQLKAGKTTLLTD